MITTFWCCFIKFLCRYLPLILKLRKQTLVNLPMPSIYPDQYEESQAMLRYILRTFTKTQNKTYIHLYTKLLLHNSKYFSLKWFMRVESLLNLCETKCFLHFLVFGVSSIRKCWWQPWFPSPSSKLVHQHFLYLWPVRIF